jgi:uncharacterized protein (TIGR03083 family)
MTDPTHKAASSNAPAPIAGQVHIQALRSSVERLQALATALTEDQLTGRAYPTDWTAAQVLSHFGSGAVIMARQLEDALAGHATRGDFAPSVWDTWNAKSPAAQRDDALAADAALLARIEAVSADQREEFSFAMGPMSFGFEQFVGLRLNEHAFHTWDIEVATDPAATIPAPVAALVVDNLDLVARFTAKPTGDTTTIAVATTSPQRTFTIDLTPDAVTLTSGSANAAPDLHLPAEAFARLIYGRLDAPHTPAGIDTPALNLLRRVYPGP